MGTSSDFRPNRGRFEEVLSWCHLRKTHGHTERSKAPSRLNSLSGVAAFKRREECGKREHSIHRFR
jgi:hypothetical protein